MTNTNRTLLAAATLDLDAHRARKNGKFDAADALASLSEAVRSGQLSTDHLYTSVNRCRLFGGRHLE